MSEQVEIWSDMAKMSAERRASNRETSTGMLVGAKIPFTSHNNGAHLVVTCKDRVIDFWPGTGLWRTRCKWPNPIEGQGVKKLIKYVHARNKGAQA